MTTTRERLKSRRRPARPVELPGGEAAHVRDLAVAQLRAIDARAEETPDGPLRQIRRLQLVAATALVEHDGLPWYPECTEEDLAEVDGLFSLAELRAIAEAAIPTPADAKN